jgi:hypothetical protein
MLKRLKELRESLDTVQKALLVGALPTDIANRFFSAEDEESAQVLVIDMNKHLGPRPLIAFSLYKGLSSDQQSIISDLLFDDE